MNANILRCMEALANNWEYHCHFNDSVTCLYCDGNSVGNRNEFTHKNNCVVLIAEQEIAHEKWLNSETKKAIEYFDGLSKEEYEKEMNGIWN